MPRLTNFIERLRSRQRATKPGFVAPADWTSRDWSDLPVYHPRDAR